MTVLAPRDGDTVRRDPMKMWLAVRTDVPMSAMKLAGQAMHAVQWMTLALAKNDPDRLAAYLGSAIDFDTQPLTGTPKIVVKAKNLHMLQRILKEARAAGIPALSVTDEAHTEFPEPTTTVVLFGPARESELPNYLAGLQFLKALTPVPVA